MTEGAELDCRSAGFRIKLSLNEVGSLALSEGMDRFLRLVRAWPAQVARTEKRDKRRRSSSSRKIGTAPESLAIGLA